MKQNNEHEAYREFTSGASITPPSVLTSALTTKVSRDINPSIQQVFTKLLGLHALSLMLTLIVCPQFGLGPVGGGNGIMQIVMDFGPYACASFCAAVFFGCTLFLAFAFMTRPEKTRAQRDIGKMSTLTAALSLGTFMLLDGMFTGISIEIIPGLVWAVVGALILLLLGIKTPQLRTLH